MAGDIPSKTALVSRPAVPPPVRVRRNVLRLLPEDRTLVHYADAIRVMQSRRLDDPTSWRYQAAIHDYTPLLPAGDFEQRRRTGDINNRDPRARPDDVFPSDQGTFWRACQHNCWHFLPWHRMYLHFFERIIMKIVEDGGGPSDWALPYWNYSEGTASALLPEPFRVPAVESNTLFVRERVQAANDGRPFLDIGPVQDTSLRCLTATDFPGAAGFGGLQTINHPPRGGAAGRVESAPHNTVHGTLGGANGFMSGFISAPLDPMFWLHHCNIDRLWEVWVRRQKRLGLPHNPTTSDWTGVSFPFHDATGAPTSMTSGSVVDTKAAPMGYIYDDIRDPT